MSRHAWLYVIGVILAGMAAAARAILLSGNSSIVWSTMLLLLALTCIAQLSKRAGPNYEAWHVNLTFFFAGVLLLPPSYYVVLVVVPHAVEWALERLRHSRSLRRWYMQPFNMAVHIVAGLTARNIYFGLNSVLAIFPGLGVVLAMLAAALAYVMINHYLVGQVLVLARGRAWHETGLFSSEALLVDLVTLLLGYTLAVLWGFEPWLLVPGLAPLLLVYRTFRIPQLQREAQTDAKTGLLNARHWTRRVQGELDRAVHFNRPLSLIMLDIDDLRRINNTYGHLVGDAVLIGVANLIRNNIRHYDVAGRFGGEEFAIVLPETDEQQAAATAERLRKLIEAAWYQSPTQSEPIKATASFGVASFPENGSTLDQLVHEADVCLYQAKMRGKNRVVSSSQVPHSLRLDSAAGFAQPFLPSPYQAAYAYSTPTDGKPTAPNGNGDLRSQVLPVPTVAPQPHLKDDVGQKEKKGLGVGPVEKGTEIRLPLSVLLTPVIVLAVTVVALGLMMATDVDLLTVGLFVGLAAVTEAFEIRLYEGSSLSVSVAVAFAAALLAGIPGLAAVSLAIVLTHALRRRPKLYKVLFNWSTHLLAGLPAALLGTSARPLTMSNVVLLGLPALLAALFYYLVDTGLIAVAISLSGGVRFRSLWKQQYGWLGLHYLVLCTLGMFMALAYRGIGWWSVLTFALPVLLTYVSQRRYVAKTEQSVRELRRLNRELAQANREVAAASQAIRELNDELFLALAKIIDLRDPFVHNHALHVARYAEAIGSELGLPEERLSNLRQAALLHDIGKIGIPEQILHKTSRLTDAEYELMKAHVTMGAEFLTTSRGLRHLIPFVRHHHERWDGSGYPDGLRGEEIPLEARILAVCDAVEAMASDRPYHQAMSPVEIIAELRRCAGTQFDAEVVAAFIRVVEREGLEMIVNSARQVVAQQTIPAPTNGFSYSFSHSTPAANLAARWSAAHVTSGE